MPLDPLNTNLCPTGEISPYLDGELSPAVELELELHLAACAKCRSELNTQKTMLIALRSSLDSEPAIELPDNFTRSVVTNAESRVNGLRRPSERLIAIFIGMALFLFALFALGPNASTVFAAMTSAGEAIYAVGSTAVHFVYGVALGLSVIVRSMFSGIIFSSAGSTLSFAVLFLTAAILFSRLYPWRSRT
ncbi:MAG: zf-HC2 domain-containing protein [Acidobacteriota bacterium]